MVMVKRKPITAVFLAKIRNYSPLHIHTYIVNWVKIGRGLWAWLIQQFGKVFCLFLNGDFFKSFIFTKNSMIRLVWLTDLERNNVGFMITKLMYLLRGIILNFVYVTCCVLIINCRKNGFLNCLMNWCITLMILTKTVFLMILSINLQKNRTFNSDIWIFFNNFDFRKTKSKRIDFCEFFFQILLCLWGCYIFVKILKPDFVF